MLFKVLSILTSSSVQSNLLVSNNVAKTCPRVSRIFTLTWYISYKLPKCLQGLKHQCSILCFTFVFPSLYNYLLVLSLIFHYTPFLEKKETRRNKNVRFLSFLYFKTHLLYVKQKLSMFLLGSQARSQEFLRVGEVSVN